jgi:hypothetical protein
MIVTGIVVGKGVGVTVEVVCVFAASTCVWCVVVIFPATKATIKNIPMSIPFFCLYICCATPCIKNPSGIPKKDIVCTKKFLLGKK